MDLERSQILQVFACLKDHPHGPAHPPAHGICPQVPLEILYGTALYSGVPVIVWMRDISPSAVSIIHAENLPVGAKFVACLPLSADEHLELVCRVNTREPVGTKLFRTDANFESIIDPAHHHMSNKLAEEELSASGTTDQSHGHHSSHDHH